MRVRQLTVYELKEASKILNEVYSKDVFPGMQYEEEIALLRSQMTEESLWIEKSKRKITIWGAVESDKIQGVGVIDQNGTIIFEAIKPEFRDKGIGKELTRTMKEALGIFEPFEIPDTDYPDITYPKTDFPTTDIPKPEVAPVFNTTPRPKLQPAPVRTESQPTIKKPVINKPVISLKPFPIAVVIIIAAITIVNMSSKVRHEISVPEIKNFNPLDNITFDTTQDLLMYDEEDEFTDDDETLDEIFTRYIAADMGYEIEEELIFVDEDEDDQTKDFYISYPQITFTDGRDSERVNEILANAACTHYDMMYPEPSESLANSKLISEEHPYFKSYVEYEVTYMSDDIICVAYSDHYFLGSIYAEYCDLRVRLIDLHTYEEYRIEDILNCDSEFAKYYYDKLVEQHDGFEKASLLTPDLLLSTLHGEMPQGRYFNNVIIDAEGVHIGFTYHYGDGNLIMRGWDHTHIEDSKLNDCKINDDFWNKIKY